MNPITECATHVFRREPGGEVHSESRAQFRSLTDSVFDEPSDCAYIVSHTLPGRRTIRLDRHIQRLYESTNRLEYAFTWSPEEIRSAINYCLDACGLDTARFRATALRDNRLRVSVEPYRGVPEELLRYGVDCRTDRESARSDPSTKSTRWLKQRASMHGEEVYEILLCDHSGYVVEGSSSNFFAVTGGFRDRRLPIMRTADTGVLQGVARGVVLEVCRGVVSLSFEPVHLDELPQIAEAFITSATRGVVPIRRIDDHSFHAPGPVTTEISNRYNSWIDEHSEPLPAS